MNKEAKFYNWKDKINTGGHLALMGGVVAGSAFLGGPWIFGIATILAGAVNYSVIKFQKKNAEMNVLRISEENSEPLVLNKKKKLFVKLFNDLAKMHGVNALPIDDAVVVVSKPLLDMMSNEENEALIAQEMAHVGAKHKRWSALQTLLSGIAMMSNSISVLIESFAKGVLLPVAASAASSITWFGVQVKKQQNPYKHDAIKQKNIDKKAGLAAKVVFLPVMTYFNPMFLGIYAAAKTLSISAQMINLNFRRKNQYQADRNAVEVLDANPLALITAIRKLDFNKKENLGELPKKGWLSKTWKNLNKVRPSVEKRVEKLADMARKKDYEDNDINEAVCGEIKSSRYFRY